ncbi:MAG: thrombospondin type 3 repeat-containing protein [Myxococcales bacterium]|nr:thrombospondin type 3 repeat-containing protein [Myxococcales bacterium]
MLAVRRGNLPGSEAYVYAPPDGDYRFEGTRRQQDGPDFFYRYPDYDQGAIPAGTWYLAVASEGASGESGYIGTGSATFRLVSEGEGTLREAPAPLALGAPIRWDGESLRYGEQRRYRVEVPSGTRGMEVRLAGVVGAPVIAVGEGAIPSPQQSYIAAVGGDATVATGAPIATVSEPDGSYTIVVTANQRQVSPYDTPDATYDLVVTALDDAVLDFNGGAATVVDQPTQAWRYFRVTVPSDALGWDLRLTDVTGGTPRMVIRQGEPPMDFADNPSCCPAIGDRGEWNEGEQWAPTSDLTGLAYGPYSDTGSAVDEQGRHISMGLGSPLVPGVYFVGVSDLWSYQSGLEPMSYRIESRGIGLGDDGEGDPWAIPVRDLPLDGSELAITDLDPREVAYFRVQVPAGTESLGVHLGVEVGEAMMAVREGRLPSGNPYLYATSVETYRYSGARRQKAGDEWFYAEPEPGQRALPLSTYYVAVASEGVSPLYGSYRGEGPVSGHISATAPLPIAGGEDVVLGATPVTWEDEVMHYGERRLYRLRVPPTVEAFEVRLANKVGSPSFFATVAPFFAPTLPAGNGSYYTATDGGEYATGQGDVAWTFPAQPGDVTIAVVAGGDVAGDASYDLIVTPRVITPLPWDGGVADLQLKDQETRYFRVEVPQDCDGVAQAGWLVRQVLEAGGANVQVRKDVLPGAPEGGNTLQTTARETVIVPPVLEPGTWYVAVTANGITHVTITTEEVKEARHWTMPLAGQAPTTPGVTAPVFADTGIRDDGTPISNQGSGDNGVDLGEGLYRFYRVTVPPGNGGLLGTRLEAISGDPELYMRRGAAPTTSHGPSWQYGTIYDFGDTRDGTSYGHWVPADARYGLELEPGEYWLAVYANASNVRYRLALDVGRVTDVAQAGGAVTGQSLAAGDMRYYRVQVPETAVADAASTPLDWTVNLVQQQGDVLVAFREDTPPGFHDALTSDYIEGYLRDWNSDREAYAYDLSQLPRLEDTGSVTLSMPIVRPGATYWLGVYARTDAVFDLSSAVGAGRQHIDGLVDFAGGHIAATLAPGASRLYAVDVPADAARWLHTATVPDGVGLYLSVGLVPPRSSYAHWTNSGYGSGSDLDRALLSPYGQRGNWPFVAGERYYLTIVNETSVTQTATLDLDGRLYDDDSDGDGLDDGWEYRWFGSLYYDYGGDYDNDGLDNGTELGLGTNPGSRDTDGDLLDDAAEVRAGADPLAQDSDLDQVCDGSDSAPTDPNESGPVIRLYLGKMDGGSYGSGYGTNQHPTRLAAVFDKEYAKAYWIHVTAWGVGAPDEVRVVLNGETLGYLPVGGDATLSVPRMYWIDQGDVLDGTNRLELVQERTGTPWGVKELGLFTFGETFGFDSTSAYDRRHPGGFDMVLPALDDILVELRAFDLEADDDVAMTLDGAPFLPAIPAGGDLAWTRYFQVPILASDAAPGGKVLSVRPKAGSDGDFEVRFVECRTIGTRFGASGTATEGDHAKDGVAFLLPRTPEPRELVTSWSGADGEGARYDGTLIDAAYEVRYDAAVGSPPVEIAVNPVTPPGPVATVTVTRLAATEEPSYPQWSVTPTYYGPCGDLDYDGEPDCAPACEDADGDGADAYSDACPGGDDCDDTDEDLGSRALDADCDGVLDEVDCAPDDASVTASNVGDRDCDGVLDGEDCAPDDPSVTASSVGDQDCDGVPDSEDCAPTDAGNALSNVGDIDCDGVVDGEDCAPADPTITMSNLGDRDCDGIGDAVDCGPDDPTNTASNAGDADCDGVGDGEDCAPEDPEVTASNAGDMDCDGVADGDDCAPNDPEVSTSTAGDADCDGVPDGEDCAPNDAGVTASSVGDMDCDGVPDGEDCGPSDAQNTRSTATDADCDGVPDGEDCAPNDAGVTASSVGDADCDGVPTAADCDDADAARGPTAMDGDCDGVLVGDDCDDADPAVGSRDGDLDCDGIPALSDCDDTDPAAGSRVGDADCDGVPTGEDCDDADPRAGSSAADADCDGVATGLDCDDADAGVTLVCTDCVDGDDDGHFARTAGCPVGDDCDDTDEASTLSGDDADCDGLATDADCDDSDPDSTAIADDADCDGYVASDDCDDHDPRVAGPCETACHDEDGDGAFGYSAACPTGTDCDDADEGGTTTDEDADCDGVPNGEDVCPGVGDPAQADGDGDGVGDACDVCPEDPDPAQIDTDADGVGDACADADGDGIPDHRDNCPDVANAGQADADGDGRGDACDVDKVVTESSGCATGGGAGEGAAIGFLLVLLWAVATRRRERLAAR